LPFFLVDEIVDVVIIGGGIAGLATAKAAVEAGLTIELIEKGTICGQGATAAAKQVAA
jgi:glycine/D-amino acid oxidase-like deaminating enzyme|tara:strand:- start:301 stop:474 length:174 start_codon:yes stop_codon:yes gene_type:complete